MKFRTIYADPPWSELGGGKIPRGAQAHYPVLKTPQIMALPIRDIAEDNSHLYLWGINGKLPDAFRVMGAWGFRYVTMITWAKDRFGIGQYFRGQTEHCLFGVRGRLPYKFLENGKRAQGTTLVTAKRTEHSKKPEDMRKLIEKVSHGPYLELFAREKTEGWMSWGNEVPNDIELVPGGFKEIQTGL